MVKLLVKYTNGAVTLILYSEKCVIIFLALFGFFKNWNWSAFDITYHCFLKHVTSKPEATTDILYI